MKTLKLFVMGLVVSLGATSFARAIDCRNSSTEYCYFASSSFNIEDQKVYRGSLYFKSSAAFSGFYHEVEVVMNASNPQSVYFYDRRNGNSSKAIATVSRTTIAGTPEAAFTINFVEEIDIDFLAPNSVRYTYCRPGALGYALVTAVKDVRVAVLKWKNRQPMIGSESSVSVRNE